jgi:hypothetical protein
VWWSRRKQIDNGSLFSVHQTAAVPEGRVTTKREAASAVAKLKTSLDTVHYMEPSKKTLAKYAPEILTDAPHDGLRTQAHHDGHVNQRYVRQDIVHRVRGNELPVSCS